MHIDKIINAVYRSKMCSLHVHKRICFYQRRVFFYCHLFGVLKLLIFCLYSYLIVKIQAATEQPMKPTLSGMDEKSANVAVVMQPVHTVSRKHFIQFVWLIKINQ